MNINLKRAKEKSTGSTINQGEDFSGERHQYFVSVVFLVKCCYVTFSCAPVVYVCICICIVLFLPVGRLLSGCSGFVKTGGEH